MTQSSTHPGSKVNHTVNYLLIAAGGGLGAVARYGVVCATDLISVDARWAEFFANVTGSFLMGVIIGWFAFFSKGRGGLQLFLTTGFLGGYTTFAGYSLDTVILIEQGDFLLAGGYATGSVVLALSGLFAGLWIMRHFTKRG